MTFNHEHIKHHKIRYIYIYSEGWDQWFHDFLLSPLYFCTFFLFQKIAMDHWQSQLVLIWQKEVPQPPKLDLNLPSWIFHQNLPVAEDQHLDVKKPWKQKITIFNKKYIFRFSWIFQLVMLVSRHVTNIYQYFCCRNYVLVVCLAWKKSLSIFQWGLRIHSSNVNLTVRPWK